VVVELFTSNVKEILYYAFFLKQKAPNSIHSFFLACYGFQVEKKKAKKNTEKNSRDV